MPATTLDLKAAERHVFETHQRPFVAEDPPPAELERTIEEALEPEHVAIWNGDDGITEQRS